MNTVELCRNFLAENQEIAGQIENLRAMHADVYDRHAIAGGDQILATTVNLVRNEMTRICGSLATAMMSYCGFRHC